MKWIIRIFGIFIALGVISVLATGGSANVAAGGIACGGAAGLMPGWTPSVTIVTDESGELQVRYARADELATAELREGEAVVRYGGLTCAAYPAGEFTVHPIGSVAGELVVNAVEDIRIRVEDDDGAMRAEARLEYGEAESVSLSW